MRARLLALGVAAALVAGCPNFDAALALCQDGGRCAPFDDGGGGADAGTDAAVGPDAAVDAGVDAGNCCTNPAACKAIIQLSAATNAEGIALDTQYVYWAENGTGTGTTPGGRVARSLKPPLFATQPQVIASGQLSPHYVAVDPGGVYWTTLGLDGGVWVALLDAGVIASQPLQAAFNQVNAGEIALSRSHVYWVTDQINRMPKVVGAMPSPFSPAVNPYGLALDDDGAYWCNEGSGSVVGRPFDGGALLTFAASGHPGVSIALGINTVYWADFNDAGVRGTGMVAAAPRDGGPPRLIAAQQDGPGGIALDEGYVYWVTYLGGTVMKAPRDGGPATCLAVNQNLPAKIAVDTTYAYWTNRALDGGVFAVPK